MKILNLMIFGAMLLQLPNIAKANSNANLKVRVIKSKLKMEHDFSDKLVNGQYQYPDEATATVDDEKILDDLVGVRKEFKDRLNQSAERR